MRQFLRNNGLTLTMFGLFALFLFGQSVTGFQVYNDDQREHGEATSAYADYLRSGHFIEATFENRESEYLQMGAYVLFTVFLFQRGSAESKDPDKAEPVDEDQRAARHRQEVPGPVRQGGMLLVVVNEHSLTIALLSLFRISFLLHAVGGAKEYSQEQLAHGGQGVSILGYLHTSQFWFESFQIWQSEFLAVASLWCCRSSSGNGDRRSRNRSPRLMARPELAKPKGAVHAQTRSRSRQHDADAPASVTALSGRERHDRSAA